MKAKCLILLLMPLLAFSDIQDIPVSISLTPIELSLTELSPQSLVIITSNPTIFTPNILSIIMSNPMVFTPSVLQLIVSNPTMFTAQVLQLIASNPRVFTPSVLQIIASNPTIFAPEILSSIHIEDIELKLMADGSKWGYDFSQLVIFYKVLPNVPAHSWFGFKYRAIMTEFKATGMTPELMKKLNDLNIMLNKAIRK
jgi:hypothetical protein